MSQDWDNSYQSFSIYFKERNSLTTKRSISTTKWFEEEKKKLSDLRKNISDFKKTQEY